MGDREKPAPEGLRVSTFAIAGEKILVLSYPTEAPTPIGALSASESEVLRAALGGLSNGEIAALRGRSVSTIENQLASAFRKLGVTTRAEAAMLLGEGLR
jgi:DNA-binding NarL/FixJ family response regulator